MGGGAWVTQFEYGDDDDDDDDNHDHDHDHDHDQVKMMMMMAHDKNPPRWEFVSNESGGNMLVTKSHHMIMITILLLGIKVTVIVQFLAIPIPGMVCQKMKLAHFLTSSTQTG